jgi:hypothetical protein
MVSQAAKMTFAGAEMAFNPSKTSKKPHFAT